MHDKYHGSKRLGAYIKLFAFQFSSQAHRPTEAAFRDVLKRRVGSHVVFFLNGQLSDTKILERHGNQETSAILQQELSGNGLSNAAGYGRTAVLKSLI